MLNGAIAAAEDNVFAAKEVSVKKISAPAIKPSGWLPGEPPKLDFLFDKTNDVKGWVRDNGELYMEGWIKHNHLRCATYRIGVQFGKGSPECVNVEWLTEPKFVSNKQQCNQAVLNHRGYDSVPAVKELFNEITCAQAVISCEGVCD